MYENGGEVYDFLSDLYEINFDLYDLDKTCMETKVTCTTFFWPESLSPTG